MTAENRAAGNSTADNRTAGNRAADNRVAGNRAAGNRAADNRTAADGTAPEGTGSRGGGDRGPAGRGTGDREVYVISVAAEITGMHAQTLRTYDRMGLVTPERTRGGGRRYSRSDIDQLREIQRLSHDEGVNLAGIKTIIALQAKVAELEEENDRLARRLAEAEQAAEQAGARRRGEIVHVPRSTAVVMWEPRTVRRRR
ncbi:Putative heat shock protein HspR [Corynebacterium bovis DSM 20582 = CIP 54.80]|uniref:MerR family transcriptional regulator/heat shock protein HspR n=1 Tax=Corynebacterium bovis DSM 20582 = CIP 54.80 TaxID=927655 RepID=A0A8H9YA14_9CORY|nr:MerR family transcriptional regulator/heat shock protein HspR [Corynebacterium bovis DSM 20582 = CIP 54.80]WJY78380.1 Putative heat shock protein HspR [Corynebacterium bovis DSM 20582 = CIP 54.80]